MTRTLPPRRFALRANVGLLALLALGCRPEYKLDRPLPKWPDSYPLDLADVVQEDVILQVTIPIIDVLFVVDNSCSMDDEQAALAANFPLFIDYFIGSGLEWHVGVTSTDLDNPAHQGKLQSAQGHLFIEENTPDPAGVYSEMTMMGTTGTGDEKGLGATYLALAEEPEGWRDSFNAGFYREEAAITTVVISDEPDATPDTLVSKREFISWYEALKIEADDRNFSCIASTDPTGGQVYIDVTDSIGGSVWDIEDPDWSGVLDYLGLQATGLKREFFLSHLPLVETIEVELVLPDGTVWEGDAVPAWEYIGDGPGEPGRNSILFDEFIPESLTKVVIRYTVLSSTEKPEIAETIE